MIPPTPPPKQYSSALSQMEFDWLIEKRGLPTVPLSNLGVQTCILPTRSSELPIKRINFRFHPYRPGMLLEAHFFVWAE